MTSTINNIYIFGAHSRAQTLKKYLTTIKPSLCVKAFLTGNDEKNERMIDGSPVIDIRTEASQLDIRYTVYIGTRGIYHEDVKNMLVSVGFTNIIPVTPKLDMELRNEFLKRYYTSQNIAFEKISDYNTVKSKTAKFSGNIYIVKSTFDSQLEETYELKEYQKVIQVGAALTNQRISDVLDNVGDNISERNQQFCELTALYWIWKNVVEDEWVGIEHYRRHFILPDKWQKIVYENNIDVILPTPLYVHPSVSENYRFRHDGSDWDNMMRIIEKKYPDIYEMSEDFFKDGLYSPCNMLIARKEVFDELCEFVFGIVFNCVELAGNKEDRYQNRYPGFLAERLISLFFYVNRENFKIVYADKNFLN